MFYSLIGVLSSHLKFNMLIFGGDYRPKSGNRSIPVIRCNDAIEDTTGMNGEIPGLFQPNFVKIYPDIFPATITVMVVHRLFDPDLPSDLAVGARYMLSGGEAHHAVSVKRLRVGEEVVIMNGGGLVASGVVAEVGKRPARVTVEIRSVEMKVRPRGTVCVACAVPKGGRADQLADQLSQVGVVRWQPIVAERSVVNPRGSKIEKWRRIAVESMKQSGRQFVMEVGETMRFEEALRNARSAAGGVVYLGDQGGQRLCNDDLMMEGGDLPTTATIFIGPEGGFTEREIEMATDGPARLVCLGEYTMRIETAAVVAAGILVNGMKGWRRIDDEMNITG